MVTQRGDREADADRGHAPRPRSVRDGQVGTGAAPSERDPAERDPAERDPASGPRKPNYPIESVDNALRLLLLFSKEKVITVSAAARAIDVAPSTAHRLLAMLHYYGFVTQDPQTKTYSAGTTLIEIGLAAVRGMDIRSQARPSLEQLSLEVGETVHLAVLREADVLFLESVEGPRSLRVAARTGIRLPACCTAAGKALLAELPPERLRALYPRELLPALTANSLRTLDELERELGLVRERGYAVNNEESEPELSAVAAVIRDRAGRPCASITVSAPVSRLSQEQATEIAGAVQSTARRIAEQLC